MKITNDILYIGVNDHQTDLFEGQYAVKNGMSYNSYVILDEKVAVMDTVDGRFVEQWLKNLQNALRGRGVDFLVVQHMEPDHSAGIAALMEAYPQAKMVASAKAFPMLRQFYGQDYADRRLEVKEGDALDLGARQLTFISAPMVHWPEVIMTYDRADQALFSADAFGKFGALDAQEDWTDEARRYYIGIVGKYGAQVQAVLKKAAGLDISLICPLHGPVLRENLGEILHLYNQWSSYAPEQPGVTVAYASIYGHTRLAALALADELRQKGVRVAVFDLARDDMAAAVASAFRYDKLALASVTYNGDVFPFMKTYLDALKERFFQNRTVAFIENGSWGPVAARMMGKALETGKPVSFASTTVTLKGALDDAARKQIAALAEELAR